MLFDLASNVVGLHAWVDQWKEDCEKGDSIKNKKKKPSWINYYYKYHHVRSLQLATCYEIRGIKNATNHNRTYPHTLTHTRENTKKKCKRGATVNIVACTTPGRGINGRGPGVVLGWPPRAYYNNIVLLIIISPLLLGDFVCISRPLFLFLVERWKVHAPGRYVAKCLFFRFQSFRAENDCPSFY